jgi:hypothetical protein
MNWGRTLKKNFRAMTFQPRLSNGAGLRLIEINGVLFAVLKCRVQQKTHRPCHDKTCGLSSDMELFPHNCRKLRGKPGCATKKNKKKGKKKTYSQTSRLENPEGLQLHHKHGKVLFLTVLLLFANELLVMSSRRMPIRQRTGDTGTRRKEV